MPTFAYSSANFPFTAFTKIYSADVNTCLTDIRTFFNTTKLDNDNIQDAGINPTTKLSVTGATAGQVLAYNGSGSSPTWVASSLGSLYDQIVGSSAQVTAGVATTTLIASAITNAPASGRILILPGYAGTENITINKNLFVTGQGYGSRINGTVTFGASSDQSRLTNCRISDDITLSAGADNVSVDEVWLDAAADFSVADTVVGEYLLGLQA